MGDPASRLDLLIFLRDQGFAAIEQSAPDTVRVFEQDEERLRQALSTWEGNQGACAEIVG